MQSRAYMVSHTHWDREWYLTQEQFRIKLVRMIDDLLDAAEKDPGFKSFMLDGQAIVVQDYLRVKPHNRQRLHNALQQGKIVCGPWYILPDELLISGEAHIRNFLTGRRVLQPLGGGMQVAYLPDSFGHPAQMPQIIDGLGMDTMVFWRGVSHQVKKTEFIWEAPGGAAGILCVHMPHGYGNCGRLSADLGQTLPRLAELTASLREKGTTNAILLMNGSDHISGQLDIGTIVGRLQGQLPGVEIQLSTMEEFVQALRPGLAGLEIHRGEFRSGERSMLLGGTLSTRMAHKQANNRVQTQAERYLEPMLAVEKLLIPAASQQDSLGYLWERILENHPHDSICGCSIDEVHREMTARFASVEQMEQDMLTDASRRIFAALQTEQPADARELLLFEPATGNLPAFHELEVGLDPVLVQEVNFTRSIIEDYEPGLAHPPLPENVTVTDETGRRIPHVLLGAEKGYESLYQDETLPEIYKVNKLRLALLLPEFEYGLHRLQVRAAQGTPPVPRQEKANHIENEFYALSWEKGSLCVLDKKTGIRHQDVAKLVDKGDAGDEYSYSWPQEDQVCFFSDPDARVSVNQLPGLGATLCVEGEMRLPARLEENRTRRSDELVSCPICLKASLYSGIDRMDFEVEFINNAQDHRLQVQFPAGIRTDNSESYNTFQVIRRPVEVEVPADWMEYPQSTHPSHGFMSLSDGVFGLSAAAEGLPEFEAVQLEGQTALNITLLRCVGWLSRTDLLTRKGNGGWTIATPDAQCPGKHSFRFAAQFHQGDWRQAGSFGLMEKFLLPAYTAAARLDARHASTSCNPLAFLAGLPGEVQVTAVKPAEAGDGIVVRLVNLSAGEIPLRLNLPKQVKQAGRANLAEQWLETLPAPGNVVELQLAAHEIATLYCRL